MTNDPLEEGGKESPLWAFTKHRALNRLALRTKLSIRSAGLDQAAETEKAKAVPPGYTQYPHANCFDGAGGVEIDKNAVHGLSAAQCTKRCDDDATCDCVTFCSEAWSGNCAKGDCWRRGQCDPDQFYKDPPTSPISVLVKKNGPKPPAPPPNLAKGALACAYTLPFAICAELALLRCLAMTDTCRGRRPEARRPGPGG